MILLLHNSETRVLDLKDGLPNLHGLRIKVLTVNHIDIQEGRKHPHFWEWLEHIYTTRFMS